MSSISCPKCQMENAYFDSIDEKGALYICPDCDYEWIDTVVNIDEEEDFSPEDAEEEMDESDIYAHFKVSETLKEIMSQVDEYDIEPNHLPVLSTIFKVVTEYKKYQVNGHILFMVKELNVSGGVNYMVIQIDQDGLNLSSGGYINADNEEDSYSEMVFQSGNEDDLIITQEVVDDFCIEFLAMLHNPAKKIETFDSGDGMDEVE